MIFATDLDRTIIYSPKFLNEKNKNSVILIETLDGKEISYISKFAFEELKKINKEIYVIPVTTRSINQFKRINTFEYCEYVITSNGGTILHNGIALGEWDDYIFNSLKEYNNKMKKIMDIIVREKIYNKRTYFN